MLLLILTLYLWNMTTNFDETFHEPLSVYGWTSCQVSSKLMVRFSELLRYMIQRDIHLLLLGYSILIHIQRSILVTYILWMIISSIRCELHDPGSFSPILNDRQSRISTYRFYTLNSQRSEKTQLTQDMYIFCFILYTIRNKNTRKVSCMKVHWSLSLGL